MSSRNLSLRRSDAWILLLLTLLLPIRLRLVDAWIGAVWINLPAGGTKCVSEEIQPNVVVLADYSVVPEDSSHEHPTISAKVFRLKKMAVPKFKLDSNAPTVSWADPKSGDSSSQIKSVYVKNLPKDVSQDQLKNLFEHHGEISKVVLPPAKSGQEKRFGFVHFAERSSAMKALKNTKRYEINGEVLEYLHRKICLITYKKY